MSYRIERDALGSMELPAEALYGIQTERARRNFPISGLRPLEPFVIAQVWIKKAAALTHGDTGRLDSRRVQAIVAAADEVLAGAHRDQVPAVPTALEAHERVGGPAATRQSVLVQAVIASYTRPTPIEIPILTAKFGEISTTRRSAGRSESGSVASHAARVPPVLVPMSSTESPSAAPAVNALSASRIHCRADAVASESAGRPCPCRRTSKRLACRESAMYSTSGAASWRVAEKPCRYTTLQVVRCGTESAKTTRFITPVSVTPARRSFASSHAGHVASESGKPDSLVTIADGSMPSGSRRARGPLLQSMPSPANTRSEPRTQRRCRSFMARS